MNILVTGSKGFVGRNLIENLKTIRDYKNSTRNFSIEHIYEFDADTEITMLDEYCKKADFVFHLAGVNRPKDKKQFMTENFKFTFYLLQKLKEHGSHAPIMLSSSIQASLSGRFEKSEYGKSKKLSEKLIFSYSKETGIPVFVYRFPNIFGKWCRPNYNSVIATFCHNIANGLPLTIKDGKTMLELLYIDDLVDEMLNLLEGKMHWYDYDSFNIADHSSGSYCYVPITYKVTLEEIVDLLQSFRQYPETLFMTETPPESFIKKLYATYISYLPKNKMKFSLRMKCDERGSFTEVMKTFFNGQFSVNISRPGMTKGEHWHNTKWEIFMVVAGHGLIQERKIGSEEVIEFEVSGDKLEAVYMLPGYTHSIFNLSDTENLVTLIWASETFDAGYPDTFFEEVSVGEVLQ